MQEKELLIKLSSLKTIKPADEWKSKQKDILLAQITGASDTAEINWFRAFEYLLPQRLVEQVVRPVWAVFLIVVLVFGGGIMSLRAAHDTTPGDSLYIAKMISEKTQQALTFNETSKAKLNLEFASNRAKEITKVIEEPGDGEKEVQIEKLSQNFKKEITAAKTRLARISPRPLKTERQTAKTEADKTSSDEEINISGALLEKSDQRMEVSDQSSQTTQATTDNKTTEEPIAAPATSTSEISNKADEPLSNLESTLAEAEKLFDERDYSGTVNKIKEVNTLIDNPTPAGAPSETTTASTSQENISDTASSTK